MNIKIIKSFLNQCKNIKKLHFSNLILKHKNNISKTWGIIKELVGNGYCNHESFPKENIAHEGIIAKHSNPYFAEIGTNLAKAIETSVKFESFLKKCLSGKRNLPR